MSTTLTVTSKGQVTLRKDILRHLGVAPGQKIDIEMLPDRRLESGEAVQVNRRAFRLACMPGHKTAHD
jgi:bifunctional DNA-binding transcriptional regulator/antitoxin component of YhaV-PrlF toxin-antitoxin module